MAGRVFGFSDAWAKAERRAARTALEQHQQATGGHPTLEGDQQPNGEVQVLYDENGVSRRTRMRSAAGVGGSGIDGDIAHHGGDPVVVRHTERHSDGSFTEFYDRFDASTERFVGTYAKHWERTGEREHTSHAPERIYGE